MTIERETNSATSSPSVEDSILAAVEKIESTDPAALDAPEETETVQAEAPEADEPTDAPEEPSADDPAPEDSKRKDSPLAQAARQLAAARKPKKRVVEAKDLNAPKPARQSAGAPKEAPYQPPQEWPTPDKEAFNALPPVAQKQSLEFYKRAVAQTTKVWQDLRRKESFLSDTVGVIQRHAPDWEEAGMTVPQAIAELAATRTNLINHPHRTLNNLMMKLGVTPEEIYEMRQTGNFPASAQPSQQPSQQRAPQNSSLTPDAVRQIYREEQQRASETQTLDAGRQQVEKLRNQVTADGRYLYPELQLDNPAIERLKPLADGIKKAQPGLSWEEVTLRAIRADRHAHGVQSSPSLADPRLPSAEEMQRVRSASVSPRGRGNPTTPTRAPAKAGESVLQTLERNVAALYGKNSH